MAIFKMLSKYDQSDWEGAYCPLSWNGDKSWDKQVILKETHKGLCLFDSERNMRDDSDFYMTVWDVESKSPKTVMFASTRGWTYPCYSSYVDATPEVVEAYQAWKKAEDRRLRVMAKLQKRNQLREYAKKWGMSYFQVKALLQVIPRDSVEPMDKLLKTKNFRSKFRASLAEQVRKWVETTGEKYRTPLSPKQMMYL